MAARITATDVARNLSEVLNQVRYRGESYVIVRNGEELGMLSPVAPGRTATLRELVGSLAAAGSPDDRFAADLEAIRREAPALPGDPWRSS